MKVKHVAEQAVRAFPSLNACAVDVVIDSSEGKAKPLIMDINGGFGMRVSGQDVTEIADPLAEILKTKPIIRQAKKTKNLRLKLLSPTG